MQPRARWIVAAGFATCAVGGLLVVGACTGGVSEPRPVPALASSPQAAAAFDQIREAWGEPDHTAPGELRQLLESFLVRFPADGLVPLARIYLALLAMQQGDFAAADRQLAASDSLPPGTARDLWTVARARRQRLRDEPEAALELLRPLVGKNVDPVARAVFEEELTLDALAAHRDYEAISYMDAWLRASTQEDKNETRATVTSLVERIRKQVLVDAFQAMRSQGANLGYDIDIQRILAGRLAKIATESGDAELARRLLDPDAGVVWVRGEGAVQLGELATSRRGLNMIEGRTIGLLLPTESPELRDESADVLRGVMWALGLPRGLRKAPGSLSPNPDAGVAQAPEPCVPLEPAPPPVEPRPQERLRLVTRDDAGSAARTEVSLDELAGDGAAVVIAGLDAQTAARAERWGEAHGVAVIVLVAAEERATPGFGFVLGESRASVVDALAKAVPSLASGRIAPVIDVSEVQLYPAQGGRVGSLTLLSPISCDIPATRAGEPRFPVTEWDRTKTRAWLVSGSPSCARDVIDELTSAHLRGVVGLTLEAAMPPPRAPGLRVISASAGIVPSASAADPRADELLRFSATLGNLSWWTALGRDAATLARVAVAQLPADVVTDLPAVKERRKRARDLLASANARLWTTERASWTGGRAMSRTICTLDAPSTPAAMPSK